MFEDDKNKLNEEQLTESEALQEEESVQEETAALEEQVSENAHCQSANNEPQPQIQSQAAQPWRQAQYNYAAYQGGSNEPKKSVFLPIAITAACALVAGIVFSLAFNFVGAVTREVFRDRREIDTTTAYINRIESEKNVEDLSVEAIVEGCLPSVVSITNRGVSEVMTFFGNYQQESVSTGTGIIIGKNDTELLIVTNYHVIADSRELTVVFAHGDEDVTDQNSPYVDIAQVKGYDADKDIAVISVKLSDIADETMENIAIATIGDSNALKMGSGVIAIGNALGYGQSTTRGIVSALNREVVLSNANGDRVTNRYIQTDAAINKGNSGGALLNMSGELVGINSAKVSASGVEGMGYAIPISDVEELIGELMNEKTREVVEEGKRGYLGINGNTVSESVSLMYGIPVGVRVSSVGENTPAERGGLKEGDVITKLDRTTISAMEELQARLSYYESGERVTLTVKRPEGAQYTEMTLEITLGSRKEAGIE